MKHLFFSLIALIVLQSSFSQTEPVLRIGLVADPQYANKPATGSRIYRESCRKLEDAIGTFNDQSVDFVQNLGDIIDGDWGNYDSIIPVYHFLRPDIENHHLLGNHDFAIDSSRLTCLLETLSMPGYYYSYVREGWRFVVLDATDYAFFSKALHGYAMDQVESYYDAIRGQSNHFKWNSAIGPEQQNWLKQQLDSAGLLGQNVIIFSHMPVRPLGRQENLWNDYEIIRIIENHPQVVAYINGHNHQGGYIYKNGIHYITIHGMVEAGSNSYGILEIFKEHMTLIGFGNQESIHLGLMP
jgi:manganese-dependent ADP-ribose/CDP-alcohol diphosphatase